MGQTPQEPAGRELVSEAIGHYHDLLAERHSASTREALERRGSRILRPHFIERGVFEEILRTTALLNRALVTAADRLARDPALRRKLDIPPYLDPLIEIDGERGAPSMVGRFDGLVDRSGMFRVIEYNSTPAFDAALPVTFMSLPITRDFARRYAFRTTSLASRELDELQVRDETTGGSRPAVVALPVTSLPAPRDKYPRPNWSESADARACRVHEATLDEFRHQGGRLTIERDERIIVDTLLFVWDDLIDWASSTNAVFDAIRAGSVRVLSGVSRGLLCGYKHTFELLTNPEYISMFAPDVAAAASRHVPWTRAVRNGKTSYRGQTIDLLPFLADSRQRWVLKPSGGSRGIGVVIGDKCTDAAWRQALKRALTQKYVVQERVLGSIESFPFSSREGEGEGFVLETSIPTCEPFVWSGTTPADAIVRLSSTGNHTLGGGGTEAALWIIEGRE